jgi:histidine ammonia-lyase
MRDVVVDGSALTIDPVVAVARGQARVRLGDDVPEADGASRSVVVEALRGDAPVYGVNTGFGALADTPVTPAHHWGADRGWLDRPVGQMLCYALRRRSFSSVSMSI